MRLTAILLLVILAAGCTPKEKPDALLAKAREAELGNDYPRALEMYRTLVREHPDDSLAGRAQLQIAAILQNVTRDLPGAVEAYREFIRRWPDSGDAPKAMFLMGYVYHNEIGNLDSAASVYGAFLAKYPDHEMAASARYELEHLGKPPEELLPPGLRAEEEARPGGKDPKGGGK